MSPTVDIRKMEVWIQLKLILCQYRCWGPYVQCSFPVIGNMEILYIHSDFIIGTLPSRITKDA